MKHIIECNGFCLELEPKVFESDVMYPVNTNLTVFLKGELFQGSTSMDIDIKQFAKFTDDISELYRSLSGLAVIKEPYGSQFIGFSCDKKGHIIIKGEFACFTGDSSYEMKFEDKIDQTCLKGFVEGICEVYSKYKNG